MDFRFDPRGSFYEAISGVGQFGLTFDDFGNRFVCSNRNPCKHIVLEDRYIKRNPFLAVPAVFHDVAAAGDESRVFPITRAWTTSTLHAGQFTAACGLDLYRGDALPAEYYGNSFTCEPTGNLVHREIMKPLGATFTARPSREGVEFLASSDEWFRPVNTDTGPDGALYIVDMYRAVIEHPQFMPEELKNRPDLRLGDDRGRIYRIVRDKSGPRAPQVHLDKLAGNDLVGLFESQNAWLRETAQRLIVQRQDRAIESRLKTMAAEGKTPQARVHALHTLDGLGLLKADTVASALDDAHPRVREQAVLLSEQFIKENETIGRKLLALAETKKLDGRERYQMALTLGQLPEATITAALQALATAGADDEWTRRAIASSVPEQPGKLLVALTSHPAQGDSALARGRQQLSNELATLVGSRKHPEEIAGVLEALLGTAGSAKPQSAVRAVLLGISQAMARRGSSLAKVLGTLPKEQSHLIDDVKREQEGAVKTALDDSSDAAARQQAIALLAFADYELVEAPLTKLLKQSASQETRVQALDALAAHRDPRVGPLLLADFQSQTPGMRRAVLDAVIGPKERATLLLDEIEAKRIAASELDRVRADRLAKHSDPAIRERAKKLLASSLPADRQKVLAEYQSVLSLAADATRGREVFQKNCSTCHRIGDIGVNVAPDIADSRVKKPEQILTDILQPNRAIDANYVSYSVQTSDGLVLTGIITSDTASSITLKQPENKVITLLRQDIEEIRSSGVSLMPEGLEKNINQQQMADLIAFIKNWRYLDGRTPLAPKSASK
jgi:putative heme-binding domain-containing protein